MGISPEFPLDPFEIINPEHRWFPSSEELRESKRENWKDSLPSLVPGLREKVHEWRASGYEGATEVTKALLQYWFVDRRSDSNKLRYYFCQREAVETIIYIYEIGKKRKSIELIEYDKVNGYLNKKLLSEDWLRLVIKMATGSGKTKVLSLIIAWSYYNKIYDKNSELVTNFLVIAPNIIVLERLKTDFEGNEIFSEDKIRPENGYKGKNWTDDFQLKLHIQDEVNITKKTGNIFLSNIHRVFSKDVHMPSLEDENREEYILGPKPVSKTTDNKIDLGDVVRDIDELMILNDEAHHIHDEDLAWSKSIKDIHNNLKQRDSRLTLQIDVSATPKNQKGQIFSHTVVDYPLVEAIKQNIVKKPLVPDGASRGKLQEQESIDFVEKYKSFIELGYVEWKKTESEAKEIKKKAVLFVMVDNTDNCDTVGKYLEENYLEFKDAVLVIHTNKKGEISESATGKKKDELDTLRKESKNIDLPNSKYKAIVSVMMLREGWDVKSVTTIVGLRAFSSKAEILPEQALGRGLRKRVKGEESVSVIGNKNFMDFIDALKSEGVILEEAPMGSKARAEPHLVKVRKEPGLDIILPRIRSNIDRRFNKLIELDVSTFSFEKQAIKNFSKEEQKHFVFEDTIEEKEHHRIEMSNPLEGIDASTIVKWFTMNIIQKIGVTTFFGTLYPKVKEFIETYLFGEKVNIEDSNITSNLSRIEVKETIFKTFERELNNIVNQVETKSIPKVEHWLKLSDTPTLYASPHQNREVIIPKKSVFDRCVLDSQLEIDFVKKLEKWEDVIAHGRNYMEEVGFRVPYMNKERSVSNFYPDFFVRTKDKIYIVETKGYADPNVKEKIVALKNWCANANEATKKFEYDFVFVDEETFKEYKTDLESFEQVVDLFRKFKRED